MGLPKRLSSVRVIVAGAGLAGLAAARALEADGAEVAVVEARDRVGGRVWTIRDGFGGQHAEAGADLIEGEQRAVHELARELNLQTTRILGGGFAFYGTDQRGRLGMQSAATTFQSIGQALGPLVRDYRLSEQRWDSAIAARLARQSVAEWLETTKADEPVKQRVRGLRGLFLADPDELSMLALVDFFAGISSGGGLGHTTRIKGGNDRLATGLARKLKTAPELRTVLRRVHEGANAVTVTLESPAELVERRADYLVSALPASTLCEVIFDPGLPPAQQAAISGLRYGAATRVLLQFSRRFWVKDRKTRLYGTDQPFGAVWDGNEEQRRPKGILSLLAGGGASATTQQILREEGAAGIVGRLRWLGKPAPLTASRAISWEHDPWARGGYAYFHRGLDPLTRDLLARPTRRIVFAGEHTSIRWQGYMNGAIESGKRAAAEVAALHAR